MTAFLFFPIFRLLRLDTRHYLDVWTTLKNTTAAENGQMEIGRARTHIDIHIQLYIVLHSTRISRLRKYNLVDEFTLGGRRLKKNLVEREYGTS